jgi:uncharacterized protein (TIGR03067 family)
MHDMRKYVTFAGLVLVASLFGSGCGDSEAKKKALEAQRAAEERAEAERLAAEKKIAEEKDKADKEAADKKAAEEQEAAEKKAAAEQAAAVKRAAEEQAAALKRAAEEKAAAERKAAEEKAKAAKEDANRIQGVWSIVGIEADGKTIPEDQLRIVQGRITFGKDTIMVTSQSGPTQKGTYKIDPSKDPKQIDYTLEGEAVVGIYSLEQDVLKIRTASDGAPRPVQFTHKPGTSSALLTLKRIK